MPFPLMRIANIDPFHTSNLVTMYLMADEHISRIHYCTSTITSGGCINNKLQSSADVF